MLKSKHKHQLQSEYLKIWIVVTLKYNTIPTVTPGKKTNPGSPNDNDEPMVPTHSS